MEMTAVLMFDAPETCEDCPCLHRQYTGDQVISTKCMKVCNVKGKVIHKNTKKPKWCPLMILDIKQEYKTEKEKKL